MDETEKDFKYMMASHWVDTAHGEDLDRLGAVYNFKRSAGETDHDFQGRLKTSIISYRGGGTLSSLRMMARIALGLPYRLTYRDSGEPAGRVETDLES